MFYPSGGGPPYLKFHTPCTNTSPSHTIIMAGWLRTLKHLARSRLLGEKGCTGADPGDMCTAPQAWQAGHGLAVRAEPSALKRTHPASCHWCHHAWPKRTNRQHGAHSLHPNVTRIPRHPCLARSAATQPEAYRGGPDIFRNPRSVRPRPDLSSATSQRKTACSFSKRRPCTWDKTPARLVPLPVLLDIP